MRRPRFRCDHCGYRASCRIAPERRRLCVEVACQLRAELSIAPHPARAMNDRVSWSHTSDLRGLLTRAVGASIAFRCRSRTQVVCVVEAIRPAMTQCRIGTHARRRRSPYDRFQSVSKTVGAAVGNGSVKRELRHGARRHAAGVRATSRSRPSHGGGAGSGTTLQGARSCCGVRRRSGERTIVQTRPTALVESGSSSSGADRYRVRAVTETNPICAPASPSSRSSTAASPSPLTL
jgi:hypothetical protein